MLITTRPLSLDHDTDSPTVINGTIVEAHQEDVIKITNMKGPKTNINSRQKKKLS